VFAEPEVFALVFSAAELSPEVLILVVDLEISEPGVVFVADVAEPQASADDCRVVRKNSMLYPRPIPLESFQKMPFEMSGEEIEASLEQMAGREDFRDICRTTPSIGTVFLFSTLYLEPDYASMLAEWFDVGQFQNP
jgi:hypothetical protein